MSQWTFSDTLNRLAPFFSKFFRGPKVEFFPRGGGEVEGGVGVMGSKVTKFCSRHFYSIKSLGTSGCRKITLESFLSTNKALAKNVSFDPKMTSSFVGYFFFPGPLGGQEITIKNSKYGQ